MQRKQPTIYIRLWVAFGVLVMAFAVASYVALSALAEVGRRHKESSQSMHALHAALMLEGDVRDQYIHQAHTIINADGSHLHHYEESKRSVEVSLRGLRGLLSHRPLPAELAQIDEARTRLDQIFSQEIVPNVASGSTPQLREAHERAEAQVNAIVAATAGLVRSLDAEINASDAQAEVLQRQTYWRTMALLASASLFALGVGAYLGRSIVGPIRRLEAGVNHLRAGDLTARVGVEANDELGRLAARFNEMAGSLKEHQERSIRDEKLAGIGRLAAGVAHEINNPLGVILGYTRLLGRKLEGPQEELRVIEEEVSRCREIVQGLLDLSRPTKLQLQELDLSALVAEVCERLSESHELNAEQLQQRGGALRLLGDELSLRQVVLNLVQNAIEATDAAARIIISVEESTDGRAILQVQDSGPGISAEATERLFEPFFTTKPKGTGLGLAVTRAIIEAHHGQIEASNAPEGGAVFRVTLPLHREGRALS